MQDNFLTAREVARILKISLALSYRLIAQGQIPAVRFGRSVRVRADGLESFISRNLGGNSMVSHGDEPAAPGPSPMADLK